MLVEFHRERQQEIHRAINSSLLNISLTSHSKIKKWIEVGYPAVEFLSSMHRYLGFTPSIAKKKSIKYRRQKHSILK